MLAVLLLIAILGAPTSRLMTLESKEMTEQNAPSQDRCTA